MPANALDYITVRGFKSIASIEKLKLGPINVLIGANGSGKSNFLEVFRLVDNVTDGRLRNYVQLAGGADKILYFGSKVTEEITVELWFSAYANPYDVILSATTDDALYISNEVPSAPGVPRLDLLTEWKRNHFGGWRLYHLHDTAPMRKTASVDDNRFLRPDGSNLAALLFYLQQRHSDSCKMIRRTV